MQVQNSVLWQIWKWNLECMTFNLVYFPKPNILHTSVCSFIKDILCSYSMPGILLVTRGTKMFKINTLSANSLQPRRKISLAKCSRCLSYPYILIRNNNVPNLCKSKFLTYTLIQILIYPSNNVTLMCRGEGQGINTLVLATELNSRSMRVCEWVWS